jgi:phosphoglycolate phosphatase
LSVKGVIFDLDGTLVDTIEDIGTAANLFFERHGFQTHTREEFLQWIGNGAAKFIQHGLGGEVSPAQLKAYVAEFRGIYGKSVDVKSNMYEGIPELLDKLTEQELKLAVLSNKPHDLTLKVVKSFLSTWPLYPVFGQREGVPRKPDPSAALEIAGLMELKPEEILFVGDSLGDMKTAKSAGMIPVGVTWGYGNPSDSSFHGQASIINHPEELLSQLLTQTHL